MAALTWKCPSCGGELVFDPASQEYKCPYCLSQYTQQQLDELNPMQGKEEENTQQEQTDPTGEETAHQQYDGGEHTGEYTGQQSHSGEHTGEHTGQQMAGESSQGARVYHCASCGAEIVTDETTAATFCYYCHNPVVLEGQLSGEFLPDHIIPFKISREEAVSKLTQFMGRKKFIPRSFYSKEQIDKVTGVYYPYWCYDWKGDADFHAKGTKTRMWRVGDTEYTETSIYAIERSGHAEVANQLREALNNKDRALVERVQPFDLEQAQPFNMSYLSGFMAEKRNMDKGEFREELQNNAQNVTSSMLEDTAGGYGILSQQQLSVSGVKEEWKYMLLPVWVLTYRAKSGKMYYYALNGQTGETAGVLPVDKKKLTLCSLALAAIVLIIALIGGYMI